MHWVLLDLFLTLDGDDGGEGALGDDGDALALRVLLGQVGDGLGDGADVILLVSHVVRLGKGGGLGLVADDIVTIGQSGVQGVLEELRDEGGRQGQDEGLVVGGGLLGQLHDGRRADFHDKGLEQARLRDGNTSFPSLNGERIHTGEVITTNVVHLSTLDQLPDLGLLQELDLVVVSGTQLGAHGAVVAGDDDGAAAGGLLRVDAVLDPKADLLDGIAQDGGVLVITDTTRVDDAVGWQHVLGATGRVLGGAAGDQLGVVVVEKLLEDAGVLSLGQDGIVGLEAVFVQERLISNGLDVWN